MRRRLRRAVLAGVALALGVAAPAFADPAGPTDYLSEVVAVDPPTPAVSAVVIGGDSFVELTVVPGTDVVVVGYRGEEYLWFRADGVVLENQNSPSKYTNEERYGGSEVPGSASADAEVVWAEIGDGGRWAWHDHRAHWMQQIRPVGLAAGDQILEAVIPLRVDGAEVDVTVISTWQPPASSVPTWLGLFAGAAAVGLCWWLRRSRYFAVVTLPVAVVALAAGLWQYLSLPSETGPRPVWWLLPALATASAAVAVVAGHRGARFVSWAAVLVTAVELAMWGFIKRDGLSAAIIPTDAPGWFDRFATSSALAAGGGLVVLALIELFAVSASRAPTGSPQTAPL